MEEIVKLDDNHTNILEIRLWAKWANLAKIKFIVDETNIIVLWHSKD